MAINTNMRVTDGGGTIKKKTTPKTTKTTNKTSTKTTSTTTKKTSNLADSVSNSIAKTTTTLKNKGASNANKTSTSKNTSNNKTSASAPKNTSNAKDAIDTKVDTSSKTNKNSKTQSQYSNAYNGVLNNGASSQSYGAKNSQTQIKNTQKQTKPNNLVTQVDTDTTNGSRENAPSSIKPTTKEKKNIFSGSIFDNSTQSTDVKDLKTTGGVKIPTTNSKGKVEMTDAQILADEKEKAKNVYKNTKRSDFASDEEFEKWIYDNNKDNVFADYSNTDVRDYLREKGGGADSQYQWRLIKKKYKNQSDIEEVRNDIEHGLYTDSDKEEINNFSVLVDTNGNPVDYETYSNSVQALKTSVNEVQTDYDRLQKQYEKGLISDDNYKLMLDNLVAKENANNKIAKELNNYTVLSGFEYYDYAKEKGLDTTDFENYVSSYNDTGLERQVNTIGSNLTNIVGSIFAVAETPKLLANDNATLSEATTQLKGTSSALKQYATNGLGALEDFKSLSDKVSYKGLRFLTGNAIVKTTDSVMNLIELSALSPLGSGILSGAEAYSDRLVNNLNNDYSNKTSVTNALIVGSVRGLKDYYTRSVYKNLVPINSSTEMFISSSTLPQWIAWSFGTSAVNIGLPTFGEDYVTWVLTEIQNKLASVFGEDQIDNPNPNLKDNALNALLTTAFGTLNILASTYTTRRDVSFGQYKEYNPNQIGSGNYPIAPITPSNGYSDVKTQLLDTNLAINNKQEYNAVTIAKQYVDDAIASGYYDTSDNFLPTMSDLMNQMLGNYNNSSVLGNAIVLQGDLVDPLPSVEDVTQAFFNGVKPTIDNYVTQSETEIQNQLVHVETLQSKLDAKGVDMDVVEYASLPTEYKTFVDEFSKAFTNRNINLVFKKGIDENGYWDGSTNTLVINPESPMSPYTIAFHELLHSVEGTKYFEQLVDLAYPNKTELQNTMAMLSRTSYKGANLETLKAEAVVKKLSEEKMRDTFLNHLAKYQTGLAYKFKYDIGTLINKITKSDELREIESVITKALRSDDVDKVYLEDGYSYSKNINFKDSIREIDNGTWVPSSSKDSVVVMSKTPSYLVGKVQNNGNVIQDNIVLMHAGHIYSALNKPIPPVYGQSTPFHNLTIDNLDRVEYNINNPIAVFDYRGDGSVLMLVDDFDTNGYPLIYVLQTDNGFGYLGGQTVIANTIKSMYGYGSNGVDTSKGTNLDYLDDLMENIGNNGIKIYSRYKNKKGEDVESSVVTTKVKQQIQYNKFIQDGRVEDYNQFKANLPNTRYFKEGLVDKDSYEADYREIYYFDQKAREKKPLWDLAQAKTIEKFKEIFGDDVPVLGISSTPIDYSKYPIAIIDPKAKSAESTVQKIIRKRRGGKASFDFSDLSDTNRLSVKVNNAEQVAVVGRIIKEVFNAKFELDNYVNSSGYVGFHTTWHNDGVPTECQISCDFDLKQESEQIYANIRNLDPKKNKDYIESENIRSRQMWDGYREKFGFTPLVLDNISSFVNGLAVKGEVWKDLEALTQQFKLWSYDPNTKPNSSTAVTQPSSSMKNILDSLDSSISNSPPTYDNSIVSNMSSTEWKNKMYSLLKGSKDIRSVDDIKTFEEAQYGLTTSDFGDDEIIDALENGWAIGYSTSPIVNGTPIYLSKNQVEEMANGNKIYSKPIYTNNVAWSDNLSGVYANANSTPTNVKFSKGKTLKELQEEENNRRESFNKAMNEVSNIRESSDIDKNDSFLFGGDDKLEELNDLEIDKFDNVKTAKGFANSNFANEMSQKEIFEDLENGKYTKANINGIGVVHNAYANSVALDRIAKCGSQLQAIDEALNDYNYNTMESTSLMCAHLYAQLSEQTQTEDVKFYRDKLLKKYLEILNVAGRTTQSRQILDKTNPEFQIQFIYEAKQIIEKEKKVELSIDPTLEQQLKDAKTDEERAQARDLINLNIASQLQNTLKEQLNAWRYLSMLGNPRTWGKNTCGNFVQGYVADTARLVQGILEKTFENHWRKYDPNFEKKGGISWGMPKEEYKLFTNLYKERFGDDPGKYFASDTMTKKSYNQMIKDDIYSKKKAFTETNTPIIGGSKLEKMFVAFSNKAYDITQKGLSDVPAMSKAFAHVLHARLNANKVQWDKLDEATKEMWIQDAKNEATYICFNSPSKLATELSKFQKNTGLVGEFFIGTFVPFKRTQINLAKQMYRYSPIGLVGALFENYYSLPKGNMNASDVTKHLSQGLTGTGILALGALLASFGLLRTSDDDNKRKAKFDSDNGEQDYSLTIDGVGSFTLDWLDPSIAPLAMGVNLYNWYIESVADGNISEDEGAELLASLIYGVLNPLMETSMMDGISDVFKSYKSDPFGIATSLLESTAQNRITSYIPTFLGTIARVIDPYRRNTSTTSDDWFTQTYKKIVAKIPGLTSQNEPYINRNGEETLSEDFGLGAIGRVMYNLLPGYFSSDKTDKYDEELYRLYNEYGQYQDENQYSMFPSSSTESFQYDKEAYEFDDKEYAQYSKTRWSTEREYVNTFIDSDYYNNYSDEDKVKIISGLRSYAGNVAKAQILADRGIEYDDSSYLKVKSYFDMDITDEQKLSIFIANKMIDSAKDEDGETITNSKSYAIADAYADAGVLEDVFDYIEKNGIDSKDFGLNKTVYKKSIEDIAKNYEKIYGEKFGTGYTDAYAKAMFSNKD